MAQSEERPSKIQKLDSGLDDDQVAEFSPSADVGSLKGSTDKVVTSTENEAAEICPSASQDGGTVLLSLNGNEDVDETKPLQPLSKNQLKKLRNKQKWEEGREYRKVKRREKIKEKKIRKAEARATMDPQTADDILPTLDHPKKNTQRPVQLPITFVLDCDFDDLMTEAELISLGSQLTRCYSDNRSVPYRAHLVVSSFGGKLKHRFETVLASNHLGWKGVKFTADDFVAAAAEADAVMRGSQGGQLVGAFTGVTNADGSSDMVYGAPPEESNADANNQALKPSYEPSIVYLTSDSPHTLDVLSPYTTYIIGGLVDKNRHKGICYKRAMSRDIPTAKLPIGEYMTMQSRSVLATNHVAEIMLMWLEYGDWAKAFLDVIPKRKEAKLKVKKVTSGDLRGKEDGHASSGSQEI
jgi:tRNA (guanine9-N1)-methyltransferase